MSEPGKRVSWVELYLDLVFVLAVAQLAHVIVADPELSSVWIALGLFVTLWWTWVGFAVLYNRAGSDDPVHRLLFLAASVPIGLAAVAIEPAAVGDSAVFAASMAAARVVLAAAHVIRGGHLNVLRQRIARACILSAGLFVVSIWVPSPLRYVLWAVAIAAESSAMLAEDREAAHRARRDHDLAALAAADRAGALDPHHFAERFGLFLIILLGEVVVEAGQAAVDGHVATVGGWAALVAAMLIAAGLWWLYFDSTVDVNRRVLELAGGSPTMARAIFAVGHMLPAFALLITAAGVGLLLEEDPPGLAPWLACVGVGMYLAGTRATLGARHRLPGAVRALLVVATFWLARLEPVLGPHGYLWLLAAWVIGWAALTTRAPGTADAADVDRYLGRGA